MGLYAMNRPDPRTFGHRSWVSISERRRRTFNRRCAVGLLCGGLLCLAACYGLTFVNVPVDVADNPIPFLSFMFALVGFSSIALAIVAATEA